MIERNMRWPCESVNKVLIYIGDKGTTCNANARILMNIFFERSVLLEISKTLDQVKYMWQLPNLGLDEYQILRIHAEQQGIIS